MLSPSPYCDPLPLHEGDLLLGEGVDFINKAVCAAGGGGRLGNEGGKR